MENVRRDFIDVSFINSLKHRKANSDQFERVN